MKRFFLVALCTAFLSGCATTGRSYSVKSPDERMQEIAMKIKTKYDAFRKTTTYQGPAVEDGECDAITIRAWKIDGVNEVVYQIYVKDRYFGKWHFYSDAYDEYGESLDFTQISREVESCSRGGCIYSEHVGMNVSRNYLERKADRGVRFKISGRGGEEVCALSSPYIKAVLATVPLDFSVQSSTTQAPSLQTPSPSLQEEWLRLVGQGFGFYK